MLSASCTIPSSCSGFLSVLPAALADSGNAPINPPTICNTEPDIPICDHAADLSGGLGVCEEFERDGWCGLWIWQNLPNLIWIEPLWLWSLEWNFTVRFEQMPGHLQESETT